MGGKSSRNLEFNTKNKANIVYGENFAKEEMLPNIWLFFQKNNKTMNLEGQEARATNPQKQ